MIVERIQRGIREQFGENLDFPAATRQAFRNLAEATKIRLSNEALANIEIDLGEASDHPASQRPPPRRRGAERSGR